MKNLGGIDTPKFAVFDADSTRPRYEILNAEKGNLEYASDCNDNIIPRCKELSTGNGALNQARLCKDIGETICVRFEATVAAPGRVDPRRANDRPRLAGSRSDESDTGRHSLEAVKAEPQQAKLRDGNDNLRCKKSSIDVKNLGCA